MANWKTETRQYVPRLNELRELLDAEPLHPASIPRGPLDAAPTALQSVLHQAVLFYEVGVWLRSRETIIGILILWKEGCISAAVSLMRILFELWAASEYQTAALEKYESTGDLESSARTIGRLFEGVRDDVLLPWGEPASKKSIHVMDTIRHLASICPDVEKTYDQLCESAHANQPRFLELWYLGRLGDNWENVTVRDRGHTLLEQTVTSAETSIHGIVKSASKGLNHCGELYVRN